MGFSENLARIQAEHGETNYRLAKEIGVHESSIKNWKTGTKPHPKNVALLEKHYKLKKGTLLKSERGRK